MSDPRISLDEAGHLDDFCATDVQMVHFEAIAQNAWYATVKLVDGRIWQLDFGAKSSRAQGYAQSERVR